MPLVNPYRHGAYHFTVAALLLMGVNKAHKFSAFAAKLKQVWTKADAEGWRDFKNRKARNEATAKDLDGRIFQNCRVLQRTKDYGKPSNILTPPTMHCEKSVNRCSSWRLMTRQSIRLSKTSLRLGRRLRRGSRRH